MDIIALTDELRWEAGMASRGFDETMASELKGGLKQSKAGTSIKMNLTKALVPYMQALCDQILSMKHNDPAVMVPFATLDPTTLAFLTVRATLDGRPDPAGNTSNLIYRKLCQSVAREFLIQIAYIGLQQDETIDKRLHFALVKANRSKASYYKLMKALRASVKTQNYGLEALLRIGSYAVECLIQAHPKLFGAEIVKNDGKTPIHFILKPAFWDLVRRTREDIAALQPHLMPTIAQPKPWSVLHDGEPTMGGYYLLDHPLVKSGRWRHTNSDMTGVSEISITALNHVQSTPWTLNRFMVDLITKAVSDENDLNGTLPLLSQLKTTKGIIGRERDKAESHNATLFGRYGELKRQIGGAKTVEGQERFWFPHNFDWRLRMYSLPFDLHPQGNDLSRSLLSFANGVPITKSGIYWLAVYIAGLAGKDKLTFDQRVDWTHANHERIYQAGKDPLVDLWWTEEVGDEKPWQFLAAAREWYLLSNEENPEAFITHLPIQQDGSCNGMQHYSLMARDEVGAIATNCKFTGVKQDLYSEVANRVTAWVMHDAPNDPVAALWVPKFSDQSKRRKVVKRAVMTTPYGVTNRGITSFMIKDEHVADLSDDAKMRTAAAIYMTARIRQSIDDTMAKGREVQNYFSAVALGLAKAQVPLSWRTPAGSVVIQKYTNLNMKRVRTPGGVIQLLQDGNENTLNALKCAQSAPPNVVHSCDGAHLQLTCNAMFDAGIRSLSMIHDSYGTHAPNVDLMRSIIKEQAYEMYRENYLEMWAASVRELTGRDIPSPPSLGTWDIREVLQAEYMFA